MSVATASIEAGVCSGGVVAAFVAAVVAGEKELSVLCTPHVLECTDCGRTAGCCPSTLNVFVTPFDAVVPASVALAAGDTARARREIETLVACLAGPDGSVSTMAALARALPLTAAPIVADLATATGESPWERAATLMMWPAVIDFAIAGVVTGHRALDMLGCTPVVSAAAAGAIAAAVENGRWRRGDSTGSVLAMLAVRFALGRRGLPGEVVEAIGGMASLVTRTRTP